MSSACACFVLRGRRVGVQTFSGRDTVLIEDRDRSGPHIPLGVYCIPVLGSGGWDPLKEIVDGCRREDSDKADVDVTDVRRPPQG